MRRDERRDGHPERTVMSSNETDLHITQIKGSSLKVGHSLTLTTYLSGLRDSGKPGVRVFRTLTPMDEGRGNTCVESNRQKGKDEVRSEGTT